MSATYLSLTNELLRRMGEVTLDTTEFDGARNIQALAKDAINSSIREVMHYAQEWPFSLVTETQTLTVGQGVYDLPADASNVDWDSFYLKQLSAANNTPHKLPAVSYVNYIDNMRASEDQTGTGGYGPAVNVYQTQEMKFGVTPKPDQEYEVEYKYWSFPADLSAATDTMIIPARFRNVVIDGAMMYMMIFRSNEQSAAIHRDKFDTGIRMMRRLLMDEPMYMRSTVIVLPSFSPRVF